jgi:magnesium transporter
MQFVTISHMCHEDTMLSKREISFETAAGHATTRVPVVGPDCSVYDIQLALRRQAYESVTHIVVCGDGQFLGIVRIEDLLTANEELTARQIMDASPPVVTPGTDQEEAAWQAVQRQESALAVVDAEGRFAGLILPHQLLAVLLWEHEEDLSRLGGFLKSTTLVRAHSQESVLRRFWHRIPWLLLGLAGAFVAADIVAQFELKLQEAVILAFFIPGIVYLADAVGTQTETVVVRGLSVGVGIRQVIGRELMTGLLIGLALTLVMFPLVLWRWGEQDVALGVSLSLLAACSTATFAAMSLPWLFDRLGIDPAFRSGPLATVIQDLLSILLYFVITTSIVH